MRGRIPAFYPLTPSIHSIALVSTLLLGSTLLLVSCDGDSDPTGPGPAAGPTTWHWTADDDSMNLSFSDVALTPDDHIIAVGYTEEIGMGSQVLVVKFTLDGEVVWSRKHGGLGNEAASRLIVTSDGAYAIVGGAFGYGDSSQGFIMIVNADGTLRWERTYDKPGLNTLSGIAEVLEFGGGFLAVGYLSENVTWRDWHILRVRPDGDVWLEQTFGWPNGLDEGRDVVRAANGEYTLVGSTTLPVPPFSSPTRGLGFLRMSHQLQETARGLGIEGADLDAAVATHNSLSIGVGHIGPHDGLSNKGFIYWLGVGSSVRTWLLPVQDSGHLGDAVLTSKNTYLLAGNVQKSGEGRRAWLVEFDRGVDTVPSTGGVLWSRTYGTGAGSYIAAGVVEDPRGGYIVAGYCNEPNARQRAWLFRTDDQGNTDAIPPLP